MVVIIDGANGNLGQPDRVSGKWGSDGLTTSLGRLNIVSGRGGNDRLSAENRDGENKLADFGLKTRSVLVMALNKLEFIIELCVKLETKLKLEFGFELKSKLEFELGFDFKTEFEFDSKSDTVESSLWLSVCIASSSCKMWANC